jgi:O-antigen ligase
MFPYATAGYFLGKSPWKHLVPLAVLTAAMAYASSRGAWLCGGLGALWTAWEGKSSIGRQTAVRLIVITVFLALGGAVVLTQMGPRFSIRSMDIIYKANTLTDVQTRNSEYSVEVRERMISGALENFERRPIIGVGLTNLRNEFGHVSHNDFLGIMAELGTIGLIVFGTVMLGIYRLAFERGRGSWLQIGAKGSLLAIGSYLLLINIYTTTMFWLMTSLALVIIREASMCNQSSVSQVPLDK